MPKWGWFSTNDDGEVVSKTECREDGTIHRYEYTKPDDISKGHGHEIFSNMDRFIDDDSSWKRDKNDSFSKDRPWKGNGYDLDESLLENLSINELIQYKNSLIDSIAFSENEILLLKTIK